jgi:hypothetical protein
MDLSNPKLRKILVGVAIFVVVVFIVIRFFRRSNYSYPNPTEQNEYTIASIVAGAAATATTPASLTVTTSSESGIKPGELVFLYGLTGGTLSGTKPTTNIPPGVTAPAGATAVYVLTVAGSTFTIEGTVSAPITGGKVQTIGYQPMTSMNEANTTCQNQYAFDLLDNTITPKVFTGNSPQTLSSTSTSLNLASPMTLAPGDRVTVVGANESTGSPAFLMVGTGSTNSTTVTFTAASIAALAGGTATILPQSPVANVTKAYNTRQGCISASAMTYTLSHCKYLPPADGSRPLIPTAATDPVAAAAYSDYTTAMNTIQAQYAPALTRAQNGTFPQGGTLAGATLSTPQKIDIVTAARKADLAGATRKYLASVCPGFYAPGDPQLPDPTPTYTKWSVKTGPSPAPSTFTDPTFWYATPALSNGTGGISDADIMAWVANAGIVTYSGGVSGVTVTSGGSGYVNGSTVSFSGGGGSGAAGTAVVTNGALTGVTITAPGTGYTSAPAAVFTAGTGAVATVSLVQTLNASGPFITSGTFTPSVTGQMIPYTADRYSRGPAGEENWRKAYYSGAGTYPRPTYV